MTLGHGHKFGEFVLLSIDSDSIPFTCIFEQTPNAKIGFFNINMKYYEIYLTTQILIRITKKISIGFKD